MPESPLGPGSTAALKNPALSGMAARPKVMMAPRLNARLGGWIVAAAGLIAASCHSAQDAIVPVIPATDSARAAAMRSAPVVVIAEIQSASLVSKRPKEVEKPEGIGGPMVPRIPLYLAKIAAKGLLTLRGPESKNVQFYSWVWASGKHGGPRLFHLDAGSVHALFLKNDAGYLHTVCDYPNCDLQIGLKWSAALIETWRAGYEQNMELPERIVAVRLKSELGGIQDDFSDYSRDMYDLVDFTSPSFVVGQLGSLCQSLTNPVGRKIACSFYADQSRDFWRR
jgi:hypothetical protein